MTLRCIKAGTRRERPAPGRLPGAAAGLGVPAAIEVSHLTKVFGGRTAVSDVSFSVAGGEVFGFLGPNGAGKTTTVRILGTLISPTSGSATVAGIPVGPDGAAEIRQRISVMPESPGLYQRLTVTENLEYFARLYGLPRRQARIAEALAAVGLSRPRARPGREPVQGPAAAGGAGPVPAERPGGHVPGRADLGA